MSTNSDSTADNPPQTERERAAAEARKQAELAEAERKALWWRRGLGGYQIILVLILLYLLCKIWPPQPWPTAPQPRPKPAITTPINGQTINDPGVTVLISVESERDVSKVELYDNGRLIDGKIEDPYAFDWDTTKVDAGAHTLEVKAYDDADSKGSASVTVLVKHAAAAGGGNTQGATGGAPPVTPNPTTRATTPAAGAATPAAGAATPLPGATITPSPAGATGTPATSASAPATGSPSPTASPSPGATPRCNNQNPCVDILGREFFPTLDVRLILLVLVAGALGSFIHTATSFADYVGNNRLSLSWTWWYVLRPFIGAALALVIYFVIRGGFITGTSVGNTASEAASFINPFGMAALAGLAGLFSKEASDKLSEVFKTLFRAAEGQGDAKRGGKLEPLTVTGTNPNAGPKEGHQTVQIVGTGFSEKATVAFDTSAAAVTEVKPTMITVTTPAHAAGKVDVTVTNIDGHKFTLKEGYEYQNGSESSSGTAATTTTPAASIDPAAGSTAGDDPITISGTGFADGLTVTIGDAPAKDVVVVNPTTITAKTPAHIPGKVEVIIESKDGQKTTLPQKFTYTEEEEESEDNAEETSAT